MDVFAAVNTRIACRAFLDKPVDLNIVRELIVRAQRAASGGNLQSWNVYALANKPLADFKRIVAERIARDDPRHAKSEYPIYPEPMFGPYKKRREAHGLQLYGSLGIAQTTQQEGSGNTRRTSSSSTRRLRCSLPLTGGSARANGPTSGAISTLSPSLRGATASTLVRRKPGRGSTTPSVITSSCRWTRCCFAAWRLATATGRTRPTLSARHVRTSASSASFTDSISRLTTRARDLQGREIDSFMGARMASAFASGAITPQARRRLKPRTRKQTRERELKRRLQTLMLRRASYCIRRGPGCL
jgi:nitroreductase